MYLGYTCDRSSIIDLKHHINVMNILLNCVQCLVSERFRCDMIEYIVGKRQCKTLNVQ